MSGDPRFPRAHCVPLVHTVPLEEEPEAASSVPASVSTSDPPDELGPGDGVVAVAPPQAAVKKHAESKSRLD